MQKVSVLIILFLFTVIISNLSPSSGYAYELLIGTGEVGSFSYFAGKNVCHSIVRFDQEVSCRPVPSDNYTDNLTNVQAGSLDMALVNSKVIYDAFQKAGLFRFVSLNYDQLRLLMPLYRVPISLIVRTDAKISRFSDLAGKRVNSGAPFSLQSLIFKELMALEGWQQDNFSLYQSLPSAHSQDFIALQDGSVQGMLHVGMHPDARLDRGLASDQMDIVGINGANVSRLIDSNSGFTSQVLPAGIYADLDADIETLSLETLLITSADIDDATVDLVLDAIISAKKRLQSSHPSFLGSKTNVETLNNSYLHPHPAAILFFQGNQSRL